jgi:hypothetical protein
MTRTLLVALLLGLAPFPQAASTFHGTITDSECADANHARMRMGDTDAECVQACVDAHGATYVLFDGKASHGLSDQKAAAAFASQKVVVTGTLDARTGTIQVDSIRKQP